MARCGRIRSQALSTDSAFTLFTDADHGWTVGDIGTILLTHAQHLDDRRAGLAGWFERLVCDRSHGHADLK